ncbi:MAG: bifunctional enoyl-CoA hydratase/phosphate acetyltransferase [Chloroflexota bacterium]
MVRNFAEMLAAAKKRGPRVVAIAAADEREILEAATEARASGIAEPILIGDRSRIQAVAAESDLLLDGVEIIHESDPKMAAAIAVHLVRSGTADIVMKGRMLTVDLLRAALHRELGLRAGRLFSHISAFEVPGFDRLLFVTDAGVVVEPTLEQKAMIVQNAIDTVRELGIAEPRVAILAALEMVNAQMPSTTDAANLAKMADRGQIRGGIVDGPLALDNAISPHSAELKGIKSPVAGRADILVTPDVESGNMLSKGMTYFAGGVSASVVVGARAPLVVTARADQSESKLASIALAVLLCRGD